jgi:hypothetical protein
VSDTFIRQLKCIFCKVEATFLNVSDTCKDSKKDSFFYTVSDTGCATIIEDSLHTKSAYAADTFYPPRLPAAATPPLEGNYSKIVADGNAVHFFTALLI